MTMKYTRERYEARMLEAMKDAGDIMADEALSAREQTELATLAISIGQVYATAMTIAPLTPIGTDGGTA